MEIRRRVSVSSQTNVIGMKLFGSQVTLLSLYPHDLRSLHISFSGCLRPQDGFDDPTRVHFLERSVPVFQRPDAADDLGHVERAGGEQADDALPDRPVVAEAAAERDVFLNERIEREAAGGAAPANLADPAAGADEIDRGLQRGRNAGGIDHAIATEAVDSAGPIFDASG